MKLTTVIYNVYLRTFVPALSATTFRMGRKNCVSVESVLSMYKIERIAKTAQYHNYLYIQNHDHSVEGNLVNANSAQTVLYFFLLMLYKFYHE
jgi:hypothetical protein